MPPGFPAFVGMTTAWYPSGYRRAIMFMLKKIVSQFMMPVPLISILMLAGLCYLFFSKKQAWGKFLVFVGFVILLLFSSGPVLACVVPLTLRR